jgi:hypothetical protein
MTHAAVLMLAAICAVASEEVVELPSGEIYWWSKHLGQIRAEELHGGQITGEVQGAHGYTKFRIREELVRDPAGKTNGAKKAVQQLVGAMRGNWELKDLVQDYRQRLQRLTGVDLVDFRQWQEWLKENGDYLVWSDSLNRLVVDAEAKNAGIPTEEYRKTHPWRQSPQDA